MLEKFVETLQKHRRGFYHIMERVHCKTKTMVQMATGFKDKGSFKLKISWLFRKQGMPFSDEPQFSFISFHMATFLVTEPAEA